MTTGGPDETPAIQPWGWMVVCDAQGTTIVGHSVNLPGLFRRPTEGFVGLALRDLVGSETSHALRNALSRASSGPRPALLPRRHIEGIEGAFDCAVHAAGDATIIEIEPAAGADPFALDRARALIDRLAQANGLDRLQALAARLIQAVLQWDCATIVQFAPDGGARILAQQKRLDWPDAAAGAALFADFSPKARAVDGAARLRFLADVAAAPVALIGPAPDLDLAYLRAATVDEAARAAGGGFSALLSLPIVVEGAPWGLLLAHDRAARRLTMDERAVFELFGDFLSISTQAALAREAADEFRRRHAL